MEVGSISCVHGTEDVPGSPENENSTLWVSVTKSCPRGFSGPEER
jgi:hypothetical protein